MATGGAAAKRRRQDDKENVATNSMKPQRSVEEIYQKKSQLEHILLRPDSYVGSIEVQSQDHFIFDEKTQHMKKQKLDYVPSLYKIFDEILVNAADNLVRCPGQDRIKIDIKPAQNSISVYNNGSGLPVQMHKEHNCYVPELVFGQLLTSDNYDDSEKKVTGGRNGYGAKLTNIFSSKFVLETQDTATGKRYKQAWEKNMGIVNPPEISAASGEDFTQVTFFPDLKRLGMQKMDDDIVNLMKRRAFDVAATTHGRCTVTLNGTELSVKSFEDYVDLHLKPDSFRVCGMVNDRWEVAVGLTDGSGFQQVSFVNSINTCRGGTHVNYVADQVINALMDQMAAKKAQGGLAVKPQNVRGYLSVFVNCLIENPCFDSQTKETLTSKKDRFGSDCQLPEEMMNKIIESGILDILHEWSKAMGKSELALHLNRSDFGMQKRIFGVPKLDDANKAGTKQSADCTLILTEGDSAKALAVAGLSVIGRDLYGVFPLRGKLRNVRELTVKQMLENKEIEAICKIMALDATKDYNSRSGLRYGSIMIMTDQDFDGSHIKGLIINFLEKWFPSLLKLPGFVKEFVTPIVKVWKGDASHSFFTIAEFEVWKQANNDGKGWESKYYKGLGTSTSKEAIDYFGELDDHEITFLHTGDEDNQLIDMAFNPKRADDRKDWIRGVEEGTFVDHQQSELSYTDFINKELVLYAQYDVQRMIPTMVDGLKVGQRKVLFGAFKKKISSDIKVAQLSGYIAEHSAYHHGEVSLQGTIIGMAQTFVGSNNLNLLFPSGQFGTRLQGGKDHAASRYIFTRLTRTTRCLFPEEDDAVLEQQKEDGMNIEPKWYCPIIPVVLANGGEGIGTGWSTSIPNYNPRDIIANLRKKLRGESMDPMVPWYRGFKGTIVPNPNASGKYEVFGTAVKRGRMRMEITELPVKKWTQDYKEWLLDQLPKSGDENRPSVTEVREHHTDNSVHFVLSITPDKLAEAERKGLEKTFHLKSSISTNNMMMFTHEGKLKKYSTPEEVIEDFIPVRLEIYRKRKEHIIKKMERELAVISNRLRFVQLVVNGELEVEKRKTVELCKQMRKMGLQTAREMDGEEPPAPEEMNGPKGFQYLLSMKMWSLTDEKVEELTKQHKDKSQKVEDLRATSLETLWEVDLEKLELALDANDRDDVKEAEAAAKMAAKVSGDNSLVNQQCVLVLSRNFKAKRLRTSEWKAQNRGKTMNGNKGLLEKKKAAKKGDDEAEAEDDVDDGPTDALAGVFCCYDFDALLVFSERGMCFMLQALDVPLAKKMSAQGAALSEFLPELGADGGKITSLITVPHGALKEQTDEFVIMVTKKGMAQKVALNKFSALRPGKGIPAMKVDGSDSLCWAHRASTNCALVLATQEGYVSRIALGNNWRCGTRAGCGRKAMKMSSRQGGEDEIASTAIHEMGPQEIAVVNDKVKQKAEKAARRAEAIGEGNTAATQEDDPAKPKKEGDDDEEVEEPEEDEEDEPEEEAEDDEKMEVKEATASATDALGVSGSGDGADAAPMAVDGAAGEAGEATAAAAPQTVHPPEERCVLILTELGMGLRHPLSSKRFQLSTQGRCGKKTMKLSDKDQVVSVCVVNGGTEVSKPGKPQEPFAIWYQEYKKKENEGEATQASVGASQPPAVAETSSSSAMEVKESDAAQPKPDGEIAAEAEAKKSTEGFERVHRARNVFKDLPESEQQVYYEKANEEKIKYIESLQVYHKTQQEEMLLGSAFGLVTRIMVPSIPIIPRVAKGRAIVKCKKGDRITAVSLLSSMDVEEDEETGAAAVATAVKKVVLRRAAAPRAKDPASSTATATSSASSGNAATEQAAPGTPVARQGVSADGAGVAALPPVSRTPAARTTTRKAVTPPWLGKRGRLSRLAVSPRPSAALRTLPRHEPRQAKLTIMKPKLRLAGKAMGAFRSVMVPITEWAKFGM